MQYEKKCEYQGYHSSYDFTVYDKAFVFVDEDEEFGDEYVYDYDAFAEKNFVSYF